MALSPARNGHANGRANGHRVITHQSASHLPQPAAVRSYARIPQVLNVPNLIQSQLDSYNWFKGVGLTEVFKEVSPIRDYTEKKYDLWFGAHRFGDPLHSPQECKEREITFSQPLYVTAALELKDKDEVLEQEIFMGDIPMMTENGTFIINGAERVVVSQLVRSPGIYFSLERPASAPAGRGYCMAKLIPVRGAWLEFETSTRSLLSVKVDRKKKLSLGVFLRALGLYSDEVMYSIFGDIDMGGNDQQQYISSTLERDQYSQRENFKEDDLLSLWDWLQTNVYEPVRRQAERAAAQDREAPNLGMETRVMEALGGYEAYDREAALRVALAQIEFYQRIRPGEPSSLENAKKLLYTHFFDPRRYDLGEVGRHKMDRRLNHTPNPGNRTLTLADIVAIVRTMIRVNRFSDPRVQQKPGDAEEDDIDHLGNRRVRSVGELVQNQVRVGLLRMERMVKEKMTLVGANDKIEQLQLPQRPEKLLKRIVAENVQGLNKEIIIRKDEAIAEKHLAALEQLPKGTKISVYVTQPVAPQTLVNIRPVVAAVREFFGGSQLSQFMDQTNPLAELTHKRRLSALGPGGLSRERAGFDVRDVHFSHYGRICPIETPEGPNIGLLSSLASYARINDFGFIESPYRRVLCELPKDSPDLRGRIVTEDIPKPEGGVIVSKGRAIGANRINAIRELPEGATIQVKPFVGSGEENIIYLSADQEENFRIAQANARLDGINQFIDDRVEIRIGDQYTELPPEQAELIDVSPMQIMSVSAALIPFLEHDDANRALMGSNMQRQAVPLLRAQAPVVGTGIEDRVALDSGQMAVSEIDGLVTSVGHCRIQWVEGVKAAEHFHNELLADTEGNLHYHCNEHKGASGPCLVGVDHQGEVTHYRDAHEICKYHLFCNQYHDRGKRFHHVAHCPEHSYCLLAKDSSNNHHHLCSQLQDKAGGGHHACRAHYKEVVSSVFRSGELGRHQCVGVTAQKNDPREHRQSLVKFSRTNQGTCFDQRPIVARGDVVQAGDVLADSSSTDRGELALGQNVLVAFMSWEGFNYEDAIILSERLYREDYFTSIHIEKHEVESRDTKLGPEDITRDIPNVGETSLRDLDERGIIRVGAEVGPGDILVGKVTPKGETELTAEEKLLRAIFGEKSRDVKDTSLRVPHGERGKVIQVKELSRENKDELSGAGVNEAVRVWIAQTRKIAVGDKMAGRHGNKGVVARILPEEDMPFLPDGTPVDIILNPIGVPSRMNLGQVLETHLGWAARGLDFRAKTPVFDGANDAAIEDSLARIWFAEQAGAVRRTYDGNHAAAGEIDQARVRQWLNDQAAEYGIDPELIEGIYDDAPGAAKKVCLSIWLPMVAKEDVAHLSSEFSGLDETERYQKMEELAVQVHRERRIAPPTFGKFELFDGRTGEPFDQMVTVGSIYILKLIHLVEDKIHARSTGPYSMITQQPLGGKAQFGGQRFGEMEVWALEAYSAAYNLQEVLTVKSDDVAGRVKTYEAVVKGEPIGQPGLPESFNVLMKELQSLGLAVQLLNEDARPPIGQGVTGDTDLFQPTEVF